MKLLESLLARTTNGAEPHPVRPARHQPRRRRPPLHRPPRRLLRTPGPRRVRDDRRRGRQRPRLRLAVRTGPAGRGRRRRAGRAIVAACRPHGALVLASLDHAGGQGSSAYSQQPLWAPSRVPEVATREVPKWMEADDIAAVVAGFGAAAACAGRCRLRRGRDQRRPAQPGAPVPLRADEPARRRVGHRPPPLRPRRHHRGARRASAPIGSLGLRLSCDELAPWAGITPDMATGIAADLVACGVDYVVVVRGAIFSIEQTRPDFHQPTGFNVELAERDRQRRHRAGVPAGLDRRRRRPGRVGGRRVRRPGPLRRRRDDPRPDRRPRPRRQAAGRRRRTDPAVHPLQPDVPGPRRPQSVGHLHRRAVVGARDRGSRLVRAGAGRPSTSSSSEPGPPDWRPLASRRSAATTSPSIEQAATTRWARRRRRPERCARRVAGGRGHSPRRGHPHRRDRRPR